MERWIDRRDRDGETERETETEWEIEMEGETETERETSLYDNKTQTNKYLSYQKYHLLYRTIYWHVKFPTVAER